MGLLEFGVNLVSSAFIRSKIEGSVKDFLNDFTKNSDVKIRNEIGEIDLDCHLLGDKEPSKVSITYNIWKEEDKDEEMKRYVFYLIGFNSSRQWLNILALKYIVGKNVIWYKKSKYSHEVNVRTGKTIWKRKLNGKRVRSKTENPYFITNDKFPKEAYRKALYKALKK